MKAFDKVSHSRLILKLKSYGIGIVLLDWLKAFLTDRKQMVGVNDEYSELTEVPSGVPQGSVLGPVLFVVYINDLPDKVAGDSMLYMFADDTKLSRAILDVSDTEILQQDIYNMDECSREWLMDFHTLKCKVLKMGKTIADLHDIFNPYTLKQHQLKVVDHEKDLRVTMDVDLIFDKHISNKINKANGIVGLITRSFIHLDEASFLRLYKVLFRPYLKYANSVRAPRFKRQVEVIENVQRRATKLIPSFKDLTYEERIRKLKLPTSKYRRLRGDLIEIFKILTKKYDPDACQNLIRLRKSSVTRGHSLEIFKKGARLDIRKNSFPHRIINIWNYLPEQIIKAEEIQIFEGRLDKFMNNQEIMYDFKACFKFITKAGTATINYEDLESEAS